LERIAAALEAGYSAVKLKVEPGREIEVAGAARDRFPDVPLAVDANGAYAGHDGKGLEILDDLGLLWIEQPLGRMDFLGHARLQERLRTPICLDESIGSSDELQLALTLGACKAVSIKPGQVGGHGPARELHDLCLARGVPIRCGGMLESGIGRAHNLALATLPGFTLPGDISESRRYWERDLVVPEFELDQGRMTPSPLPGIGVAPDLSHIRESTVRRAIFGTIECES
jgi:O-succinylbenzoate synthase